MKSRDVQVLYRGRLMPSRLPFRKISGHMLPACWGCGIAVLKKVLSIFGTRQEAIKMEG